MKKPIAQVTDHAVLRYLERVKGMDIEAVRREIGRAVDLHLDHPGACGVVVAGFSYKIAGGVVTTVIAQNRPLHGIGCRRPGGERDE
ncbi:hypothetical protein QO034_06440 [Sedimentitalea sp. JM2-8]|uniref:Uncharacterized protein n=1 Tax=Sedimentitalea xiamensis TaxID=3050037 RepID=A0ABT7FC95_9RHOB|nr:hypothetical protein [Sedimentitalea xiamensis]MDK3072742.1 hypothetical protein [Sedimentitalea xiamensis]